MIEEIYKIDKRCCNGSHPKKRLTTDSFIIKAIGIHGNKYDYSKVLYTGSREKVIIRCDKHGYFTQIPNSHLCGSGCPKCGVIKNTINRSGDTEQFINKARSIYGNKYDYSTINYVNAHHEIVVRCPAHGEFTVDPNNFIRGHGCGKCYRENKKDQKFIDKFLKVHGELYNYSKVAYVNNNTKICIICKKHGEFWQRPRIHSKGHGCPICNSSKGEHLIGVWLDNNHINYFQGHTFEDLRGLKNKPLRFDFYLPKLNCLIEFDGQQHYMPVRFNGMSEKAALDSFKRSHECDLLKNKYSKDRNITLIRISYKHIDSIEKILDEYIKVNK